MASESHIQEIRHSTSRHVPALDGVRGVAILMILYCHLFWSNSSPEGGALVRLFAELRDGAWIGVDLFFVLSGYLITGILLDAVPPVGVSARDYFRNFYVRRTLRIFPLYYGFLLSLVAVTVAMGYHWSRGIWAYLTYTQNLHIIDIPYDCSAPWVNITPYWSLAIEEHFYLVWPAVVLWMRTPQRVIRAAVLGVVMSIAMRGVLLLLGAQHADRYIVYSFTPAHLDGLLIGAALCAALRTSAADAVKRWALPVCTAALVLVTAQFAVYQRLDFDTRVWTVLVQYTLLALGFGGLLTLSLRSDGVLRRLMESAPLRFFGKYSYGLYVFHFTVYGIVGGGAYAFITDRVHSKMAAVLGRGLWCVAVTTAAAWISYNLYERHFLALKDRWTR